MSDEWCPENDGAYQAEMAALHRDGVEHRVHKARAEIERLTKERDEAIINAASWESAARLLEAERDEARSMLADAERDMRQRAADYLQSAVDDWRSDGHEHAAKKIEDEIPGVLALPLKHADRCTSHCIAERNK